MWALSDAAIAELPLDAPASVAWWPEERRVTTFGHLLVRVVAETAQHAGHADILREGLDGQGGRDHDDLGDAATWSAYGAQDPAGGRRVPVSGTASSASDVGDHRAGDAHQVGGGEAEVEPAPAAGHVDDVEQLGALVDHGGQGPLLADR